MSARDTQIATTRPSVLSQITFRDIRNKLEARMIELGLDITADQDWGTTIGDEGVDNLVRDVVQTENGAEFLRQLDDLAVCQMSKIGNALPGVIDLNSTDKPEVVAAYVEMERLYKKLSERLEVLDSNRGQLRIKLGSLMRENGESEFKACDKLGRPVANVKLELKYRPAWPEKDDQFKFFENIGQGDIIQPSVPWQTGEKVINGFVDDAETVVHMDNQLDKARFEEERENIAKRFDIPVEDIKYVVWNPPTYGKQIAEFTGDEEFPFRPVCNLFQSVVGKITKLY